MELASFSRSTACCTVPILSEREEPGCCCCRCRCLCRYRSLGVAWVRVRTADVRAWTSADNIPGPGECPAARSLLISWTLISWSLALLRRRSGLSPEAGLSIAFRGPRWDPSSSRRRCTRPIEYSWPVGAVPGGGGRLAVGAGWFDAGGKSKLPDCPKYQWIFTVPRVARLRSMGILSQLCHTMVDKEIGPVIEGTSSEPQGSSVKREMYPFTSH